MKEIDDKKLQELLEKGLTEGRPGLSPEEEEGLEVYNMLFEALGNGPMPDLPRDFSVKVVAELRSRKQRRADLWFYVIVTFCCLFAGSGIVAVLTRFGGWDTVTAYISRYGVILALGTVILLLIQYLDQKLIKQAFLKDRQMFNVKR